MYKLITIILLFTLPLNAALPKKKFIHKISSQPSGLVFDLPVTYNERVQHWIQFFQGSGKHWFAKWLERAQYRVPQIQKILLEENVPLDLAYLAMIESGFSSQAKSVASAVGPWQFIKPTGHRFGLTINDWVDERKDFEKSTRAAVKYLRKLHNEFDSWYLAAAAYNTGENRIRRMIKKHNTKDFWKLANTTSLMRETKEYIPKLIAAMLIAKAPNLYGFRNIPTVRSLDTEIYYVPGGTNILDLADHLKVTRQSLIDLNPELVLHFVPKHVSGHLIHIPKGSSKDVSLFVSRNEVRP